MIRRLTIPWPRPTNGQAPLTQPMRLLAVSDQVERAFDFHANRSAIEPIAGVLGCGDLDADYLAFLSDAFRAPLLFVRGNHDRGGAWEAGLKRLPGPLESDLARVAGLEVGGLSWPRQELIRAPHDDTAAWFQALRFRLRILGGQRPQIVISHVPPRGLGDTPQDPYHRGFAAYQWLIDHVKPVLWLHGHTALAGRDDWHTAAADTTVVNVTGAVVLELTPLEADSAGIPSATN